jgi:YYY domain-containing protein
MFPFLSWYLLITLLGWLTFPLVHRLFPALTDRGYTLARTAGLLIWGYAFWLLASLGLAQNDLGGVLLGLLVLAALSGWSIINRQSPIANPQSPIANPQSPIENPQPSIIHWLQSNLRLVVTTEVLFLLAFAFLALVRAANPEILGTEKPMELMLINSILQSPAFPPHDSWLSGYAISYYYFGYVMTAMLARMTSVPGTMAFNLMVSLVFALGAIGAYGILYNLLNRQSKIENRQSPIANRQSPIVNRKSSIALPLLAPLFLLIVSNIEGVLELLHRRGVFWKFNADGTASSPFWAWLDLQELSQPPTLPLGGGPARHWWWWRASRIVQDYDLMGRFQEVIDEFPFFSFLLGDLHPHVLAIPFTLLAVAVALNLYLGGWRAQLRLFGARLHINLEGFFTIALVLGGLAFLNTWDILIAAALIVCAYVLARVQTDGWSWSRLEDVLLLGLPAGLTAILLYFPFYFTFSSQAGGPMPNLVNPTRGVHLWLLYSSLLLPLFVFLAYLSNKIRGRWRPALILSFAIPLALWGLSWLLAVLAQWREPAFVEQYLLSQNVLSASFLFTEATLIRLSSIGAQLTLVALLCPALALLLATVGPQSPSAPRPPSLASDDSSFTTHHSSIAFVLLLIVLGVLLVMAPDYVYLRDQFGSRMNTVFKFYYQTWMLWSLAAAFGAAILLQTLRGLANWSFRIFMVILLSAALVYPVLGVATKTGNFKPFFGFTLDDFDRVRRESPDEAAALSYLMAAQHGVVAEAAFIHGSYTGYGRISTYTGLPTLLGWPGHESQWRGGYEPQGTRLADLETLYTTPSWEIAHEIIARYRIRYVVVGGLERITYPVQEEKFLTRLRVVFQQGDVTVYEVP